MTTIQQVLFEVEADYMGHPYFVTGNALYNALARRVDAQTRRRLQVSTGVFVPGELGAYPDAHSQSGGVPYFGTSLRPVETYEDLFLFRDTAHRWLSNTRPREAHNTHDLTAHGGRQAFAPVTRFGKPAEHRQTKRTMRWYVHCYLHADGDADDVVPLADDVLDRIRVGGGRNYGFGELSLKDTQSVDLATLDYSRIREANTLQLELLSPYVLASEYPGADSQSVPGWWDNGCTSSDTLRRRTACLVEGEKTHELATVDHGLVVAYAGDQPVATAKNGIQRIGTHAKYGFGEFRLRPADSDRVPERQQPAGTRRRGEAQ